MIFIVRLKENRSLLTSMRPSAKDALRFRLAAEAGHLCFSKRPRQTLW